MKSQWTDVLARKICTSLGTGWAGVDAAAILGSGVGEGAGGFEVRCRAEYRELPGLGRCTTPGHAGQLLRGRLRGLEVIAFCGRRHVYEGVTMGEAALPARVASALGARVLVVISAVGGVCAQLPVGAWVFVEDHINFMGRNPLEGIQTNEGPPFVDLTHTYRTDLYAPLCQRLATRRLELHRGILAAFSGPSYETPAEIHMARSLGASVVGMSIVPEAVWARFLGVDVLAFGRVANPAAGIGSDPIDHLEVVRQSEKGGAEAALVLEESLAVWSQTP